MKKLPFNQAKFLLATLSSDQFPSLSSPQGLPLPEMAIIGKSNVGKSSLINHLLKQKKLAKTSATPGKTQTINFFIVDDQCLVVDLPGYGFAKTTNELRAQWGSSIDTYLRTRSSLKLVLFLLDIRRTPSEEDLSLIQWLSERPFSLLILFTKCDTVSASEQQALTLSHLEALRRQSAKTLPYLHYSITDARARKQLIFTIDSLLHPC